MNDKPHKEILTPPPLPANREALIAQRMSEPTLNDLVEEIHVQLWEQEEYRNLLWAVHDSQAQEGSLSADNLFAAQMIRVQAKKVGSRVQHEKAYPIAIALGIILRRFGISRKQRRLMAGGERVPDENGNE